jgi:protein-L-isoaspartate(D-aspartate) O-methyltransferase
MTDLGAARQRYAAELRSIVGLRSEALVHALSRVPREAFLGTPPWRVIAPIPGGNPLKPDTSLETAPEQLYRDVLVSIDRERRLNNGQPSSLAAWLEALELAEGDRVRHVGAGTGYYTAIMAEIVGPTGHVLALECEADLAARASENLAGYPQVMVRCADGSSHDSGPCDAILVNAGATHLSPVWLDALRPGGRLVVPLTVARDGQGRGFGRMLKVVRRDPDWDARFIGAVGIYPCRGARDAATNRRLERSYREADAAAVRRLIRDPHEATETCWLHGAGFCLSRE